MSSVYVIYRDLFLLLICLFIRAFMDVLRDMFIGARDRRASGALIAARLGFRFDGREEVYLRLRGDVGAYEVFLS